MNIIKIWLAALQFILLNQPASNLYDDYDARFEIYYRRDKNLKYVDIPPEIDFYYDRIVSLNRGGSGWFPRISIGVMISADRILTSYNPFRLIMKNETQAKDLSVTSIIGRYLDKHRLNNNKFKWYKIYMPNKIDCGRQIQHLPDEEIEDDLWHGVGRRNCPLHDLLVFRHRWGLPKGVKIAQTRLDMETYVNDARAREGTIRQVLLKLENEQIRQNVSRDKPPPNPFNEYELLLTDLAKPDDIMGNDFTYCEVSRSHSLSVTQYNAEDNAVMDCNTWLPREWGHFICLSLNNKNSHKTLLSSAMLISEEKLFGVGSFVLSRADSSILVFTDVRPYHDLILNTCTYSDSDQQQEERVYHWKELFNEYDSDSKFFEL